MAAVHQKRASLLNYIVLDCFNSNSDTIHSRDWPISLFWKHNRISVGRYYRASLIIV